MHVGVTSTKSTCVGAIALCRTATCSLWTRTALNRWKLFLGSWGVYWDAADLVLDVVFFHVGSHVYVVGEAQGFLYFVLVGLHDLLWGWCALALSDGCLCHLRGCAATSGCLQGADWICLMGVGILMILKLLGVGILMILKLLVWHNGQDVFFIAARKYGFFPAKTTKKQIKESYMHSIYIYFLVPQVRDWPCS